MCSPAYHRCEVELRPGRWMHCAPVEGHGEASGSGR
jgi:hypothetical protein